MRVINVSDAPRGGGGGYFHMYAYWVCAARETPIFSPAFPFRSISFSQIPKKSVPEHHHLTFFGGFCRSGDHHFQNFLISTRSSPPTADSDRTQRRGLARRVLAVPESPIFMLKRIKLVPEPPIFKLVPETPIFTLDRELVPEPLPIFHFAAAHTYQNLG